MIQSPKLRQLVELHATSNEFWQALQKLETPIIEACQDPDKRLVSFVYRANRAVKNVALLSCLNAQNLDVNRLQQHEDTNLWHESFVLKSDLRTRYLFSPNDSLVPMTDDDVMSQRSPNVGVDPLNSKILTLKAWEDDPDDIDVHYSILELPDAPSLDHTQIRAEVPKGQLSKYWIQSRLLNNKKVVWVYTPNKPTDRSQDDVLIVFDGWNYTTAIPTPTILDNLIHDGALCPTMALFVDHDTWEQRNDELPCNETFVRFLTEELLPWAKGLFAINPSPGRTTLAGSSFGGLAACFCALKCPEVFGKVIAQSCTAMWNDSYIIKLFESTLTKPIKLYLDMGTEEFNHAKEAFSIKFSRQFRHVLVNKDYELHYREFSGGHDYNCWAASLADGLTALSETSG